VHSGRETSMHFFMPAWAQNKSHKKRTRTRYAELVFLHSVGFTCHVVHSGASERAKHRCTIFHAQLGMVWIPRKACRNMLHQTCVFATDGIYESRSALWCIRGVKHRRTIFHSRFTTRQPPYSNAYIATNGHMCCKL
jgi:hypothetical protein